MNIEVGVMGASGYMGGELVRVLLEHPRVRLKWATARGGGDIGDYHPNLFDEPLPLINPRSCTPVDVVFLALPTGSSMDITPVWLQKGSRVIDLGAAFRLKNRETWQRIYGQNHTCWSLAREAVYGVTELYGDQVAGARLVANPGCFSSAAILALAPLMKNSLIDGDNIVVNGISGSAGMGAQLSTAAHHPEIGNNVLAYNVVDHRHSYEMEQELSAVAGKAVRVHFTPLYAPIVRGILNVCHGFTAPGRDLSRDELLQIYRNYYHGAPFVKIYDVPYDNNALWQYKPYPRPASVAGTNYCYIGVDVDRRRRRITAFSVLDSLGKGGAQVGVENMNRMFGLEPRTGLARRGMHPL